MYFDAFPVIPYDAKGDLNFKDVTNLLRRVGMRAKLKSNTLLYDTYDVKEGETPEMIADKLYDEAVAIVAKEAFQESPHSPTIME